jgi:hypothetical protein
MAKPLKSGGDRFDMQDFIDRLKKRFQSDGQFSHSQVIQYFALKLASTASVLCREY